MLCSPGYVKATWAPKVFRKLEAIRCSMASEALKLGNKVPAATEEQVLLLRRVVSASMRSIRGALLGPADSPVLRKLYHDVAKSFCGEAVKDASLQNTKSPPPPRVFDGMVRRLVGETLHELGLVSSARDPSAGDW